MANSSRWLVSDWERVPGKDRRFKNKETGEVISRWKYETLRKGGVNPKEVSKIRRKTGVEYKNPRQTWFNSMVEAYKIKTSEKLGIKKSAVKVRGNSESAQLFKRSIARLKALGPDPDNSPNGELAQILVDLNFRKAEWKMPVGKS